MQEAAYGAKAARVRLLRVGIATLICVELEKILGPSKLPKPKVVRVRLPPKPPRAETRVAGVEANVELGRRLVALRSQIQSNRAYGRAVRAQFDIGSLRNGSNWRCQSRQDGSKAALEGLAAR
jgi:hypothetical protein